MTRMIMGFHSHNINLIHSAITSHLSFFISTFLSFPCLSYFLPLLSQIHQNFHPLFFWGISQNSRKMNDTKITVVCLTSSLSEKKVQKLSLGLYLFKCKLKILGVNMSILGANKYIFGANMYILSVDMYILGADVYILGANMSISGANMYSTF